MNLSDIKKRVQRQFGDESGAQITEEDIVRWANDAQMDIVRRTEILQSHAHTNSVAEDGSYALPEDFIYIRRVTFNDAVLKPTSMEAIDQVYRERDKAATTGTPSVYYIWGNTIYLHPAPAEAGSLNLDIWYVRAPVALVGNLDIPEIPSFMHEDIVRFCVARAKELDEEDATARAIFQEYEARIAQGRHEAHTQRGDSYPSVRVLPGDLGPDYGYY